MTFLQGHENILVLNFLIKIVAAIPVGTRTTEMPFRVLGSIKHTAETQYD
jgi:hypothetical protein